MNTPTRIYLKDYTAPDFLIESVQLYFKLHETETFVTAEIKFKKNNHSAKDLVLNGEKMILHKIEMNGELLLSNQYSVTDENLTVFNVPAQFTLKTQVEINPTENKSCEGLYLSQGVFCTQCEAESFRKITYFIDRPDVMTSYTVEIEADQKYKHLLSNGDCVEQKQLSDNRHYAKWIDPFKKPSYLFALVAGDMGVIEDEFTTKSGKKVKLEVYAPHGKQQRCKHAMVSLKKAMKWDEDRFGLEYDLNQYMIVSIDDFNMGAMENKGLNIFNSRLVLADEKTATDHDFDMIESVIGHEYFHNWSGNRVTCRNWFELSLKEGLTVFRDQEFSADTNSRSVQRIKDVDSLRSRQFSEDAGPNAHPVRPDSCLAVDNFYTATIYEKGAEVIRMIQTLLGLEGFNKGIKLYFERHDGQAVTIIDFIKAMSDANQIDLTQFQLWYSQAGTPVVDVTESYDEKTKTYFLKLKQHCDLTVAEKAIGFNKKPFHIPIKLGLLLKDGTALKQTEMICHLKDSEQTWTFENIPSEPVLSINRDFSAPIKLNWTVTNEKLLCLIKHDTDAFNKREACNKMLKDELMRLIQEAQNKKTLEVDQKIIEALTVVLTDQKLDLQFKALMLSLPNDQVIAQDLKVIDATAIYVAKKAITTAFGKKNFELLQSLYNELKNQDHIGARSLKNKILSYLISTNAPEIIELVSNQYFNAKNMTDSVHALIYLSELQTENKAKALHDFYTKWNSEAVVFNKWLSVNASSSSENTFDNVLKISQSKDFDVQNPNNVQALYGGFANNLYRFHTEQHNTYSWLITEILKIDKNNPQVAARLAGIGFNLTAKLPQDLKDRAQTEIKRALADSELSKNVREQLEKCV